MQSIGAPASAITKSEDHAKLGEARQLARSRVKFPSKPTRRATYSGHRADPWKLSTRKFTPTNGESISPLRSWMRSGVQAAVIDIWPPVRRKLPNGVTRFEYPFAEEVARFPGRFAYVARFDPNDPEIDDLMAEVRKAPGRLCTRIASGFDFKIMREGGHQGILHAAGKHGVHDLPWW
jgi:hypothetical protein